MENAQQYDQEPDLDPPTLPSPAEIRADVQQCISNYKRRRTNRYQTKKWKAKKKMRLEHQDQTLMVTQYPHTKDDSQRLEQDLIFDSGCTAHMWHHQSHFTTYEPFTNSSIKAACAGTQVLDILGKGNIGPLKDVLYVPGLRHCLISSNALLKQGYGTYIGTVPKVVRETNPSEVLLRGYYGNELFRIKATDFEEQLGLRPITCYVHKFSAQPLLQLHQMLGHASAARCAYECKCTKFPGLSNLSTSAFQSRGMRYGQGQTTFILRPFRCSNLHRSDLVCGQLLPLH